MSETWKVSKRWMCVLSACIGASACVHTMEPLSNEPEEVRVQISVGDTVRVLTKDSQRREMTIVAFDEDGLVGEDGRVAYSDIVFLERRALDRKRTAAASAATAGAAATIWLAVTAMGAVPVL